MKPHKLICFRLPDQGITVVLKVIVFLPLAQWHGSSGMWFLAHSECCMMSPVCINYLQLGWGFILEARNAFCRTGQDEVLLIQYWKLMDAIQSMQPALNCVRGYNKVAHVYVSHGAQMELGAISVWPVIR